MWWMKIGNASAPDPNWTSSVVEKVHIYEAVARACTLMKAGTSETTASGLPSRYGHGVDKEDYCLLDWEPAEIPSPDQAATADRLDILPSSDRF